MKTEDTATIILTQETLPVGAVYQVARIGFLGRAKL